VKEEECETNSEFRLLCKNANILTIYTNQFSNLNIVFYWKVEAKQAKKRAKRASELRLLKQFQFFNTFQQAISFVVRLSKFLDFS